MNTLYHTRRIVFTVIANNTSEKYATFIRCRLQKNNNNVLSIQKNHELEKKLYTTYILIKMIKAKPFWGNVCYMQRAISDGQKLINCILKSFRIV